MQDFEIEILKSNLDRQLNVIVQSNDLDLFKSWSSDLQKQFPSGGWRTINGSHVFINNGKVIAGLEGFNGAIDNFFKEKETKEKQAKEQTEPKKDLSFHDWSFRTLSGYDANLYPYSVGKKFTDEQFNEIQQFFKQYGFEASLNDKKTLIRISLATNWGLKINNNRIQNEGQLSIFLHELSKDGQKKKQKEIQKIQEEQEKQKAEVAKQKEMAARPSYNWITNNFGKDFANTYNFSKLQDFLEDKTKTFEGVISHKWGEGATKLGVVAGNDINWNKLKNAYNTNK